MRFSAPIICFLLFKWAFYEQTKMIANFLSFHEDIRCKSSKLSSFKSVDIFNIYILCPNIVIFCAVNDSANTVSA